MNRPRIHLIAPAGSCRRFMAAVDAPSAAALIAIVQDTIGSAYSVTGSEVLIEAQEDELNGGRQDDRLRAEDIEQALGDEEVVAVVLIRGGAWFTRVLPLINFSVLERRAKPVAVFAFSELTTLVNIVGSHDRGIGVYDMGPAFLTYGLRRYARSGAVEEVTTYAASKEWARVRVLPEFRAFFRDVVSMIEGRGSARTVAAELVRGELPDHCEATFIGGNLTVLSTLVGSRYGGWVSAQRRWLMIEDLNEKPEHIDRLLAHLTLAGFWEQCDGVLVGDFHKGYEELTPAVVSLLDYHLPRQRPIPVLTTQQIGHTWPMSPLPLHLPLTIQRVSGNGYTVHWPASALRTV